MGFAIRAWLIAAAGALPLQAQFTSPACPGDLLSADDFEVASLFDRQGLDGAASDTGLAEPVRMDVRVVNDADGKYRHSDIIFVQRTGDMKWDAYGDLWVAVGTNSLDVEPAACDAGNNVLSPSDSQSSAESGTPPRCRPKSM
jgi:hypothetical protein